MKSPANLRVLVIEDDPRMVELLRTGLVEKGHKVSSAGSAEDGWRMVSENQYDVIVLDIGLPGHSGYTIAQNLRNRTDRPAIIMLTALNQEDQIVSGLDAGADDYLTKPFSFPELAARIISAARRTRIAAANDFHFGAFQLDIRKHCLLFNGTEIHLTRSEYLLLRELALNRGEVVSRRRLMQAIWGLTAVSHGSLDTLVNTVREKLNSLQPGHITTARGLGYSLADDEDLRRINAKTAWSPAS